MFHDVRMRGFKRRADVDEVVAWVDALPLQGEVTTLSLDRARGCVLAAPLLSTIDVPAFARSAMDGWALRGEDTFGASETDPASVTVVGSSLPGRPHEGSVEQGQAVRIMTGAPLPSGADTVLRAEDGHQDGDALHVRAAVPTGRHVGLPGEDVRAGTEVLPAGRVLRPQDLGLASSLGLSHLDVRVGDCDVHVIITGDEVLPWGAPPEGVHIADANGPMLMALVERDGGTASVQYLRDDPEALAYAISKTEHGTVIVTGGSSVGEEDHAPRLLHEHGTLAWHGVGLRPAAPTGMGTLEGRPVFLLPGNPVSCLCAYDFFAGRYVRRAAGRAPEWPYRSMRGVLARKISSVLGRVDYVRVALDGATVTPIMASGASILSSTTEADGFVIVPKDHEGWREGTEVEAYRYD